MDHTKCLKVSVKRTKNKAKTPEHAVLNGQACGAQRKPSPKNPESHLNTTENSPRQTRAHVLQDMLLMSVCVTNTKVRLNICVHFTGVVIIYIYTLLQQSLHSCCSHKHSYSIHTASSTKCIFNIAQSEWSHFCSIALRLLYVHVHNGARSVKFKECHFLSGWAFLQNVLFEHLHKEKMQAL